MLLNKAVLSFFMSHAHGVLRSGHALRVRNSLRRRVGARLSSVASETIPSSQSDPLATTPPSSRQQLPLLFQRPTTSSPSTFDIPPSHILKINTRHLFCAAVNEILIFIFEFICFRRCGIVIFRQSAMTSCRPFGGDNCVKGTRKQKGKREERQWWRKIKRKK